MPVLYFHDKAVQIIKKSYKLYKLYKSYNFVHLTLNFRIIFVLKDLLFKFLKVLYLKKFIHNKEEPTIFYINFWKSGLFTTFSIP